MMELFKYPLDVQVCTMEIASCEWGPEIGNGLFQFIFGLFCFGHEVSRKHKFFASSSMLILVETEPEYTESLSLLKEIAKCTI